ncbi:alpha/beta fold hydrolase [bacterium]|nr:alpha/beta fold hydrolase [bacterium]
MNQSLQERTIEVNEREVFYRYRPGDPDRPTLMLLHGIGDAGQCWAEAFQHSAMEPFTLVAPDLPGYGNSLPWKESLWALERFHRLLDALERVHPIDRLVLVGHSMGGDIAIRSAMGKANGHYRKIYNIESNITQDDTFLSSEAIKADREGRFDPWFHSTLPDTIVCKTLGWAFESVRRYHETLKSADAETFLRDAQGMSEWITRAAGQRIPRIAAAWRDLPVARVYVHGSTAPPATLKLMQTWDATVWSFPGTTHWVMIDAADAFYERLGRDLETGRD